jgi:hypothetical protein
MNLMVLEKLYGQMEKAVMKVNGAIDWGMEKEKVGVLIGNI